MSHEPGEKGFDLLKEARDRFKQASEAEDAQRKVILSAKQFRAGDQWPEEIKIQRQGGAAIQGQAAQPPRPCLTIDRISAPVRQVSNTVRAANFSINVTPNGHGADDETAEIYKGLMRRIQNDARADAPVDWAADGAAEGGIGWFRIYTEYCQTDPERADPLTLFDQDLKLGRIRNSLSVYCDPSAVRPTKSDARWMIVTEDISRDEFERERGTAKLAELDEFRSTGDGDGWVDDKIVRIAEYWRVTFEKVPVYELTDGSVTLEKPEDKAMIARERVIHQPKVRGYKITAKHQLEDWDWAGSRIPLIPILGEELNVDGKPLVRGVIASAMDAQRMVNYTYSAAIESAALAPKAPFIVAEGQIDNYPEWKQANVGNFSHLTYTPVSLLGQPVPPPQRNNVEPPIQAMVEMLVRSEEAIKATTSIYDPSLGNTNPREKSGRAIMALQQQSEQSNSNYLDNVQRALVYAGEQLVELAPKIYDRPGRVLQILGVDDSPSQVILKQPFTRNPQGVPEPAPQMAQGMAKFYDLSKGQYAVTVIVGKAWTTKREEGVAVLGELIGKNPQLLPLIGDLFFRDLDTPGAQEAADRFKKMLPPQVQEADSGVSPEQQVAQLQQQQQQLAAVLEATSKELEAKTELVKTEAVQAERDLTMKKLEVESKERIEFAKIQADLQKAQLTAGYEMALTDIKGQIEMLKQAQAAAFAGQQQADQQGHELTTQGRELMASAEQADQERAFQAQQAQMQAEQAQQQPGA